MDPEVAARKIFIGGLSYGTDDEKLRSYFEAFGAVQDAVVMKDPVSRRSRGFGFITFVHPSHVDKVLKQDVHTIDSRKVEAKRAVPRSEFSRDHKGPPTQSTSPVISSNRSNSNHHSAPVSSSPPSRCPPSPRVSSSSSSSSRTNHGSCHGDEYAYCKIFVGGLHYDTRDGEFRSYFEKFGKVLSAEVMFNRETHKSRGFGFIVFENEKGVDLVCDKEHTIDGKLVEVKRAVPRSKIGNSSNTTPSTPSSVSSRKTATKSPGSSPRSTQTVDKEKVDAVAASRIVSATSGSYAAALKGAGSSNPSPTLSVGSSKVSPGFHSQQSPRQHSMSISSELDGSSSNPSVGHSPAHQPLPPMLPALMQQQQGLPASQHQLQGQVPTRPLRAHSESYIANSFAAEKGSIFGQQSHDGSQNSSGISFQQQQQQQNTTSEHQQPFSFSSQNSDRFSNWNSNANYRNDVERSSSLGGLGWMPSSLSGTSHRPGGREFDVGLGLGLGFGFDQKNSDSQFQSEDNGIGLNVPAPSDWASFVDFANNGSSQEKQLPPGYSSDSNQGRTREHSNSDTGSGGEVPKGNDETNYMLQELRIQASEFQPSSSDFHAENGSNGGFPWSTNGNIS